jgi:uncharacterized protein (DUF305 family)
VIPARHLGPVAGLLLALAACTPAARPAPATPAPTPVAASPAAATSPAPAAAPTAATSATPTTAAGADEHAHHTMAGMAGTPGAGGAAAVTIPPGALYTEADVRFMQHMIAHHAQAIHMSRLAPARGANPRLIRFALKIDQSQAGEIVLMQDWLRANGQAAPDTGSWRGMTMAGMLTPRDLAALEAARGPAFDRLFLTGMIRHHEGALRMVADLFATPRAGQDVDVSVLANDVETTQTAEIALMRRMLADM